MTLQGLIFIRDKEVRKAIRSGGSMVISYDPCITNFLKKASH